MKESFGNAFVFGIFSIFAFLTLFILTVSINYSRANKIKDRLLTYVQSYAEDKSEVNSDGSIDKIDFDSPEFYESIEHELATLGYRLNNGGYNQNICPERKAAQGVNAEVMNRQSSYKYCIYAYETSRGYYYGVTTYMYFDIPIIGTTLEFPIYGETRTIYNLGTK